LPLLSVNGSTHMFFAQHYANQWFRSVEHEMVWRFSQTVHPPLAHQLVALFSKVMSVSLAYMAVQLVALLLLTAGVYRFARIWVDERPASYAAVCSVFLGSLALCVYEAGMMPPHWPPLWYCMGPAASTLGHGRMDFADCWWQSSWAQQRLRPTN